METRRGVRSEGRMESKGEEERSDGKDVGRGESCEFARRRGYDMAAVTRHVWVDVELNKNLSGKRRSDNL